MRQAKAPTVVYKFAHRNKITLPVLCSVLYL